MKFVCLIALLSTASTLSISHPFSINCVYEKDSNNHCVRSNASVANCANIVPTPNNDDCSGWADNIHPKNGTEPV